MFVYKLVTEPGACFFQAGVNLLPAPAYFKPCFHPSPPPQKKSGGTWQLHIILQKKKNNNNNNN